MEEKTSRTTIRTFRNSMEAHLARTKLKEEGIPATVHQYSRYRAATGAGFLLKVEIVDVERALSVLGPEHPDIDMDEYVDPDDPRYIHCPECGSASVTTAPFEGGMKIIVTVTLGLAAAFVRRKRHCRKCGHDWIG